MIFKCTHQQWEQTDGHARWSVFVWMAVGNRLLICMSHHLGTVGRKEGAKKSFRRLWQSRPVWKRRRQTGHIQTIKYPNSRSSCWPCCFGFFPLVSTDFKAASLSLFIIFVCQGGQIHFWLHTECPGVEQIVCVNMVQSLLKCKLSSARKTLQEPELIKSNVSLCHISLSYQQPPAVKHIKLEWFSWFSLKKFHLIVPCTVKILKLKS